MNYDPAILKDQYTQACELYRHEDTLNWSKFNNMIYVTAGLWAIAGFAFEYQGQADPANDLPNLVFNLTCVVGLIVAVAFTIALWSGVTYLHHRKNRVSEIETQLCKLGGCLVVESANHLKPAGRTDGKPVRGWSPVEFMRSILKVSPTTWVLRLSPILLGVLWIVALNVGNKLL